jgi:hypothetical protein
MSENMINRCENLKVITCMIGQDTHMRHLFTQPVRGTQQIGFYRMIKKTEAYTLEHIMRSLRIIICDDSTRIVSNTRTLHVTIRCITHH